MSKLETRPLNLHGNHQGKDAEGRPKQLIWALNLKKGSGF